MPKFIILTRTIFCCAIQFHLSFILRRVSRTFKIRILYLTVAEHTSCFNSVDGREWWMFNNFLLLLLLFFCYLSCLASTSRNVLLSNFSRKSDRLRFCALPFIFFLCAECVLYSGRKLFTDDKLNNVIGKRSVELNTTQYFFVIGLNVAGAYNDYNHFISFVVSKSMSQ